MTTTFRISQMDRHTADGFVTVAHWTASQTDGEFSASTYSTASFTKTDEMNLIPFESLTEEQVIGWVKSSLGEEGVAAIETALAKNIEAQKNPVTATGTPWGQA